MLFVCSGCLHLGAGNSHFCDLAMKVLRASIVLLRRMECDTFSRCSPGFSKRWGEIRPAQLLFANSLVGCPLPLLTGWRSRVNSRHGSSRLASGWQFAYSLRAQRQKRNPKRYVQISDVGSLPCSPSRPSLAPRPPRALSLILSLLHRQAL